MRVFAAIRGLAALAAALALVAPAGAQQMSAGFEFLKAVKDRDGNKATAALEVPGTTVVNTRDISTGQSALHIVTERRDATWLRFLLGKGANPNTPDKHGVTPLQLAANLGWLEGIEVLTAHSASTDTADETGETPLIGAVHRRDAAMVRALLKAGANPDRSDNAGRTARDYAQEMGGSTVILQEIDEAKQQRKAKAAQAYGPGA